MTTLKRSLNLASGDDDELLKIAGIIICMRLFVGEDSDLLTVVIADAKGKVVEAKTWSLSRALYIYNSFNEGESVTLTCSYGSLDDPDPDYSDAVLETYDWWLEKRDDIRLKHHIYCCTDIDAFHRARKSVKTLAGTLVSKSNKGPVKYDSQGRILAQGHFIKLKDGEDNLFRALVWERVRKRYAFSLDSCNIGDCVVLLYAREQDEKYRPKNPSIYTVTTTYPPIVKPKYINRAIYRSLGNASKKSYCTNYNPYN